MCAVAVRADVLVQALEERRRVPVLPRAACGERERREVQQAWLLTNSIHDKIIACMGMGVYKKSRYSMHGMT